MISVSCIQSSLHLRPGKDDGRVRGIDVYGRIPRLREVLDEMHWKVCEIWQIQGIEPDHWARSILPMVMPIPRRRQDEIPTLHVDSAALHCGETALTLYDEATGEGCVTMCRSSLVGHD